MKYSVLFIFLYCFLQFFTDTICFTILSLYQHKNAYYSDGDFQKFQSKFNSYKDAHW